MARWGPEEADADRAKGAPPVRATWSRVRCPLMPQT